MTMTPELNQIIDKAEAVALVSLVGSEKQIEWASKIRAKMILEARQFFFSPEMRNRATLEAMAQCGQVIDLMCKEASASFWIDNRNDIAKNVAKMIAKKAGMV